MEIADFISKIGIAAVPAITVITYLAGATAKASSVDNKWIPTICGMVGGCLGVAAMNVIPSFPAQDPITAFAIGAVSGWASTGIDQMFKQLATKT